MDWQKNLALWGGVVLALVGIVGFFTNNVAGFTVNLLHSLVHLVSGAAGIALALMDGGKNARQFNKWFGVVYLLVAVLGFVAPSMMADLLDINMADNWLHVVLGVVFGAVGWFVKE
jgi:hypothetical protein